MLYIKMVLTACIGHICKVHIAKKGVRIGVEGRMFYDEDNHYYRIIGDANGQVYFANFQWHDVTSIVTNLIGVTINIG